MSQNENKFLQNRKKQNDMIFNKINTKMQEKQEQIMARKVAMNRKKVKNIVQYQEYADDDEDADNQHRTSPEMQAVNIDSQVGTNEDDHSDDGNNNKKLDDTSSSGTDSNQGSDTDSNKDDSSDEEEKRRDKNSDPSDDAGDVELMEVSGIEDNGMEVK